MTLDVDGARAAARAMGTTLGMSDMQLAHGIVRIANANMERAIRVVSVQRGFDPRDFALLAFGGAGGMHACEIADTLDITTVIVPRHAGVLSALGMLLADVTKDYSQSVLTRADLVDEAWVEAQFAPLVHAPMPISWARGSRRRAQVIDRMLDVRYVGQSFEISVPFAPGYRETFDAQHARLTGTRMRHARPDRQRARQGERRDRQACAAARDDAIDRGAVCVGPAAGVVLRAARRDRRLPAPRRSSRATRRWGRRSSRAGRRRP